MVPSAKRHETGRRAFIFIIGTSSLVCVAVLAWTYGPAYLASWRYVPQEGDVLFQSLPHSRLVNAIEGVSQSPFSHCGIVAKKDGRWVVYEALRDVEVTPLQEFLFRGRNQSFAVYRLKAEHQQYVAATIDHAKEYLGRPYDVRYRMDDERIYCSELIYKAYLHSSGQQLGKLARLGDLNWKPFAETIQHFENGPVPVDREMITPKDMADADQLEIVFTHNFAHAGSSVATK